MNEILADQAGYERGWEQAEDYWRAKEQERIIKLLANNFYRFDASNNQVDFLGLSEFILLIKGENK